MPRHFLTVNIGISMGAWYCSNILGEAKAFTPLWGNEKSETGFLITILAYIFIHKGEVTEGSAECCE